MDFNFPEKKGTGLERLIPHADSELIELMKKLVRYDPDERILARQALKDPYFREIRDADKDVAAVGPAMQTPSGGGSSKRGDQTHMIKGGLSSSSSVTSADYHENPETTHEPAGAQPATDEERTGALPTIRQENRKERERAARDAAAAKAATQGGGAESGEEATADEGTVLPPIGGLKGKRGGKAQAQILKQAGNATLQKPSMATTGAHSGGGTEQQRALGVLGTSKGIAGTSGSGAQGSSEPMSSTGAMSSTNPHSWAAAGPGHGRTTSPGGGALTVDKMNSTWAPNHSHQPRRYVPPKGMAQGGKKR